MRTIILDTSLTCAENTCTLKNYSCPENHLHLHDYLSALKWKGVQVYKILHARLHILDIQRYTQFLHRVS